MRKFLRHLCVVDFDGCLFGENVGVVGVGDDDAHFFRENIDRWQINLYILSRVLRNYFLVILQGHSETLLRLLLQ